MSLFLFLGGVGLVELVIVLAVFSVVGFFVWRALLIRVLKKGPESINRIAIIGGLTTAPAFAMFLGAIIFWIVMMLQPSAEEIRTQMDADTTRQAHQSFFYTAAHPKAKALMTVDFYWSQTEDSSPFGNDEGSDAFFGLAEWRETNKTQSPAIYVDELINEWGYTRFPLSTIQPYELAEVLDEVSPSHVVSIDNAIIATGFGQFVLEGTIDEEIHQLTKYALQRQLSPVLINQFKPVRQETRKANVQRMLLDLERMD